MWDLARNNRKKGTSHSRVVAPLNRPMSNANHPPSGALEESASFNQQVLAYIHQAAESGLYDIRGLGAKRRVPDL